MGRVEDVKVHLVARSWGWFVEQEEKFNRTCAKKRPTRDNHASMRARGAHSLTTEVRSVSQPYVLQPERRVPQVLRMQGFMEAKSLSGIKSWALF